MTEKKINSRGCCIIKTSEEHFRVTEGYNKLDVYDWLIDVPPAVNELDIVEVRFKNTRKGFYKNINQLNLRKGDIVAVEASPGHDIGIVSLTGELIIEQMHKYRMTPNTDEVADGIVITPKANGKNEMKKIYRKAKPVDIEKWQNAIEQEETVMLKARKIADELNLNMKIGDVEFQGDKTKAIFYYIADERVDFRELIKILAEEFRIRVEMRQIGARQEAGRIGGLGSCGRELCCATWVTNFVTVSTTSARLQELSLNPLKLAGQCGKLKCCLNYELECYIDARRDFPDVSTVLNTKDGRLYHQKTDIFRRLLWYSLEQESALNMIPIAIEKVKEIIELNKQGVMVDKPEEPREEPTIPEYANVVGQESLTRFDDVNINKTKKKKKKRRDKKPGTAIEPNQTQSMDKPKKDN